MRPARVLLLNLAVIFVGGALLAPPLYWLAQAWVDTFPELAGKPFRRYVTRCVTLVALIRLWPLFRDLGATGVRDLGLTSPRRHWPRLVQGLSVGLATCAIVILLVVLAGGRLINTDLTLAGFATHLPNIVPTMFVVAVLEETLFRGALFGILQRSWHWLTALAVSSLFYALVHFMANVEHVGPVTIWSGLAVVAGMFRGFVDPQVLFPEFPNLAIVGAILAWAYWRTGNLYFSIGLHAGWIFWVKAYAVITIPAVAGPSAFWGTAKLVDGWIIFLAMVVAVLLLLLLPRKQSAIEPRTAFE